MARAIWKGAINFGLVHIPVALWKATRQKTIRFRELHDKDLVPLKQKRVCPDEGIEVSREHVVKGYEVERDHFVVVDPEELEALEPDNPHSIDIEDFVQLAQVDPIYFETAYYLSPEKGAAKPYSLLLAAMGESGKAAVARVVLRAREHMVILRPLEKAISMSTLFYADEVTEVDEIPGIPKAAKPAARELKMAVRLIESMEAEFDPSKYKDEYREKVVDLLEKKAEGKRLPKARQRREPAKVIDLVSALQASLGGDDKAEEKRPARKAASGQKEKKPAARKSQPKQTAKTRKRKAA